MTAKNVKKLELGFVQQGRETWTFRRDRSKTMDVELDFLFRDLIGFANEDPDDERRLKDSWLGFVRPREQKRARIFNKDVKEAHALTRQGLSELAELGTVRRRTENQINLYLENVREHRLFSLDGGVVGIWVANDVPTAAAYCAYGLAAIISARMEDNLGQCKLRECGKYFWRPLKRGPRPTYCSEKHRVTGAKREERRMA